MVQSSLVFVEDLGLLVPVTFVPDLVSFLSEGWLCANLGSLSGFERLI
jgi:hypothetical protein